MVNITKKDGKIKIIATIIISNIIIITPILSLYLYFNFRKIGGCGYVDDNYGDCCIYEDRAFDSIIKIDGYATGINAHNWTWALNQSWCDGAGTLNNPYIIKNITNHHIIIKNSNSHFIINNCSISNPNNKDSAVIQLINVSNGNIINNSLISNNHGIIIKNSFNSTISRNTVNSQFAGILLSNSLNITLIKNYMIDCGLEVSGSLTCLLSYNISYSNLINEKYLYYYKNKVNLSFYNFSSSGQIFLVNCNNSIISSINVSNLINVISLYFCRNIKIKKCIISNALTGIYLFKCINSSISENKISNNKFKGIYSKDCNSISVFNNYMIFNNFGIYLERTHLSAIKKNDINYNVWAGLFLYESSKNNIIENKIYRTSEDKISYGININGNDNIIARNDIFCCYYAGIHNYGKRNIISENEISNNKIGIKFYYARDNEAFKNNIKFNFIGILMKQSYYNHIFCNNIEFNEDTGLFMEKSNYNFISSNIFLKNNISIEEDDCEGNIFENNILDDEIDSPKDPDDLIIRIMILLLLIITLIVSIIILIIIILDISKNKKERNEGSRIKNQMNLKINDYNVDNKNAETIEKENIRNYNHNNKIKFCPYCGTKID